MRKMFLLLVAMIYITASAKEVKIGGAIWRNLSFDVADGLECVYNYEDSVKTEHRKASEDNLHYVFTSSDGLELYVYINTVENIDIKKASAAPDTIVLPFISGFDVVERQQPVDGDIDRIITIKNKNGILQREYIGFCAEGIISFSAVAPSGDFNLADQTAKSLKSSTRWGVILLIIAFVIISLIPSFIISSAWNERKSNLPKFWKRLLVGIGISIAIGLTASLILGSNMLISILFMLLWTTIGSLLLCWGVIVF
jgi:hypothetical protein